MNQYVIGIDVGGSTTKIVGFRKNEKGEQEQEEEAEIAGGRDIDEGL